MKEADIFSKTTILLEKINPERLKIKKNACTRIVEKEVGPKRCQFRRWSHFSQVLLRRQQLCRKDSSASSLVLFPAFLKKKKNGDGRPLWEGKPF